MLTTFETTNCRLAGADTRSEIFLGEVVIDSQADHHARQFFVGRETSLLVSILGALARAALTGLRCAVSDWALNCHGVYITNIDN